jgi:hypothetical protein
MKLIISYILLFSLSISAHAATLTPSLTTQIARQESVNKRNTLAEKRQAVQSRKIAIAQKVASVQARRTQVKTAVPTVTSAPTIVSQPVRTTPPTITPPRVASSSVTPIAGVDMARVRSTWLGWYNDTRTSRWLTPYGYDSRLDSTAHDWNIVFAGSRGTNFHERTPGDGYYNYPIINEWFRVRGVNPPVISRVNHSENVSYGYYRCSESDCTDELISAIRSSYTFFINSTVHSKSVYQSNFTKIGIDVIVVPTENRYYVTVHYMTR